MLRTILRVAAATAVFGAVHSALASRAAKNAAAGILGERRRNALYRPFYLAQSTLTLAALAWYVRGLPGRTLYHVRGPAAWLMRAGQAGGIVLAVHAARQVGILDMLGATSLAAWRAGRPVPPEPEAQGPAPAPDGTMRATGPFRWTRHPLNFSPIPVLWLVPRMTDRLAAFNIAATAYLVLGSRHEEARLRTAYGPEYEAYRTSGVSFFLPSARPGRLPRPLVEAPPAVAPAAAERTPIGGQRA